MDGLLGLHKLLIVIVVLDISLHREAVEWRKTPIVRRLVAAALLSAGYVAFGEELLALVGYEGIWCADAWALLLRRLEPQLLNAVHCAKAFKEAEHVVVRGHVDALHWV